jgi:hypothetical protein
LLAVAVAVVVSMALVRLVAAVGVQPHYSFTQVDLLPQQVMPMLLGLAVLAV